MRGATTIALGLSLGLVGCTAVLDFDSLRSDAGGGDTDAGESDAGLDAGTDAGMTGDDAGPGMDAGADAGADAGSETDAGTDAGMDAGMDAGSDAGFDAGSDAGFDSGFDAGSDAGFDAGFDACASMTFYMDVDGDGFGDPMAPVVACVAPADTVTDMTDCDDANPDAFPGGTEVCDGADNDCSGSADDHTTLLVPSVHATISAAIAAAPTTGGEICVAPGTYGERLSVTSKTLTIVSTDGAATTIIDSTTGSGFPRGLDVDGASANVTLRGFSVTGGDCQAGCGIRVRNGAHAAVDECDIHGNLATGAAIGAGMSVQFASSADISNTRIRDNTATVTVAAAAYAAGLQVEDASTVTLRNVAIVNNTTSSAGSIEAAGLVVFDSGTTVTGENVVIAGNTATLTGTSGTRIAAAAVRIASGASLSFTNASIHGNHGDALGATLFAVGFSIGTGAVVTLINVDMSRNTVGTATGVSSGGYGAAPSATITWTNCNTFGNDVSNFDSGITVPTGTVGNISEPPLYQDTTPADPNAWDLRLRAGSLLRNAGLSSILDPDMSVSDIGAYGGPGAANW